MAFLDYEDDDVGNDFWRWSFGGEFRTSWLDVYANRYLGITDGKLQSDGKYRYTADGFDVEAVAHVPDYPWISGFVNYYLWEGMYGDADEKGFRYGVRLRPGGDRLQVELVLDTPKNSSKVNVGGRISYSHTFGTPEAGTARLGNEAFDPRAYFFDPVRREYSQRIRSSTTGEIPQTEVFLINARTLNGAAPQFQLVGSGQDITLDASSSLPYEFDSTKEVTLISGANTDARVRVAGQYTISLSSDTTGVYRSGGKIFDLLTGSFVLERNGSISLIVRGQNDSEAEVELIGTRLRAEILNDVFVVSLFEGTLSFDFAPNLSVVVAGIDAAALVTLDSGVTVTVNGCGGLAERVQFVEAGTDGVTLTVNAIALVIFFLGNLTSVVESYHGRSIS
jgi:hypothetical protein